MKGKEAMMQTDASFFLKPNIKVFVILDHRNEPDQLISKEYLTDKGIADKAADKVRSNMESPPTAIEVVELKFAIE